jgi:hypothetical protein
MLLISALERLFPPLTSSKICLTTAIPVEDVELFAKRKWKEMCVVSMVFPRRELDFVPTRGVGHE